MATSKKATNPRVFHDDISLSAAEEAVLRLRHGLVAENDEMLKRKTNHPDLLAQLLELERAIVNKSTSKKSRR